MDLLIVDDEPMLRRSLGRLFANRGLLCRGAASPSEAERLVAERAPDAVLCDVDLGGSDGVALCRALAGRKPGLRFVFMSGSMDSVERAVASGLGPALLKPFDVDEACRLLDALWGR